MASGGARNRSGPQRDPLSGRSERRGVQVQALPNEGWRGEVPVFPLPARRVFAGDAEASELATSVVRERELELWRWAWRTPQAAAWSLPSESWRLYSIAMWVRTYVVCEQSDAKAADRTSLHRFADQIGLTPAGLRENGWAVAPVEVSAAAGEVDGEGDELEPERRLSVVS